MQQRHFITATGTDSGKTFLTCQLIRYLVQQGLSVSALKPIISGWQTEDPESNDTLRILEALQQPINDNTINTVSPFRFKAPLSPDMAASQENSELDLNKIISFCQQPFNEDIQLIEGVGGVMVPLNNTHTTLDLLQALSIPAILVCGSYLGSLSHTLTAYHILKKNAIPITAIVVNAYPEEIPTEDTIHSLSHFIDEPILSLPSSLKYLYQLIVTSARHKESFFM